MFNFWKTKNEYLLRSLAGIRWDPSGEGDPGLGGVGVFLISFLGRPFFRRSDVVFGVEPSVVLLFPLEGLEFGFEVEGWGAKPRDVENK